MSLGNSVGNRAALLILIFLTALCHLMIEPVAAEEGIHGSLVVVSPSSQTVYNDTMPVDLTIAWSVSYPIPWMHVKISCSIDYGPTIAMTNKTLVVFESSSSVVYTHATSLLNVSSLTGGKHRLNVIATGDYNLNNDFVKPLNYSFTPIIFHVRIMTPPDIIILSPQNKTYNEANIPLSFAVDTATSWIGYSLDGQNNKTIRANTTLTGLINGVHSLIVYANDTLGNMGSSQRVTFTIAIPPKISILSPQNKTYIEPNVPLVFTLDNFANCTFYSLDGQLNKTMTGNITLTGLYTGMHSIVVYANDTFGNTVASEIIYFNVKLTVVPEPEPFPTTLVVSAILIAVVVVVIVIIYVLRKRKK